MKYKKTTLSKTQIAALLKTYRANLSPDRLAKLAGIALEMAVDGLGRRGLRAVLEDIVCLGGMLRDGLAGRFRISRGNLLQIGAALAYVVCPADLIADILPVVGQMDDAAVVAHCAMMLKGAILAYREWKGAFA